MDRLAYYLQRQPTKTICVKIKTTERSFKLFTNEKQIKKKFKNAKMYIKRGNSHKVENKMAEVRKRRIFPLLTTLQAS